MWLCGYLVYSLPDPNFDLTFMDARRADAAQNRRSWSCSGSFRPPSPASRAGGGNMVTSMAITCWADLQRPSRCRRSALLVAISAPGIPPDSWAGVQAAAVRFAAWMWPRQVIHMDENGARGIPADRLSAVLENVQNTR